MQWAIAELINRPEVFNKVRNEIDSVVGGRLVEESDIPSLPYLQAVIKETLRLYPSVPVSTRQCRETCKIKGFDIPEKTMVAINLYAIMRDPELWDDPAEFRPERFLSVYETKGQNLSYVPFGSGRRRCPGSTLASSLLNISVAAMVQCFDWKVGDHHEDGDDGDDRKVNMEVGAGMSLGRAHPLRCLPIAHFTPFASN
ncbi:Cytochrome P450, E-class, group I [Trema orientale]|uniref:Cytochrome P450, E-class, group I n=1 Tax=Trema orientale TaxID=63057 RepID=A0A2P5EL29_TREOI|nr:Cytochrome P450, E-class, group I [Trema orientale]